MLSGLLSSLTSLSDFLSRGFFIGAFLPTVVFTFVNGLTIYVSSWEFRRWFNDTFLQAQTAGVTLMLVAGFFAIWIASFVVAALTGWWIKLLEGANWWDWLRKPGVEYHKVRLAALNCAIEAAVLRYGKIENQREAWRAAVEEACKAPKPANGPDPKVPGLVGKLQETQRRDETIEFAEIEALQQAFVEDIKLSPGGRDSASAVEVLTDYAFRRSLREHGRLETIKRGEFGEVDEIRPTRFGNIGLMAEAHALRAYRCNLTLVWAELLRAVEAEDKSSITAINDCKMQLNFFVVLFWSTLVVASVWSLLFAIHGHSIFALAFALGGPLVAVLFWYEAASEQYRALQNVIISCLNGPARFRLFRDLHLQLPQDIAAERVLWEKVNFAIMYGRNEELIFKHPSP